MSYGAWLKASMFTQRGEKNDKID